MHLVWCFYREDARVYSEILSFLFAIQESNQNPKLLLNINVGYVTLDSYSDQKMTADALLDLLSPGQANAPNYKCGRQNHPLAVLEDSVRDISMLGIYKIPQVEMERGGSFAGNVQFHFAVSLEK